MSFLRPSHGQGAVGREQGQGLLAHTDWELALEFLSRLLRRMVSPPTPLGPGVAPKPPGNSDLTSHLNEFAASDLLFIHLEALRNVLEVPLSVSVVSSTRAHYF